MASFDKVNPRRRIPSCPPHNARLGTVARISRECVRVMFERALATRTSLLAFTLWVEDAREDISLVLPWSGEVKAYRTAVLAARNELERCVSAALAELHWSE